MKTVLFFLFRFWFMEMNLTKDFWSTQFLAMIWISLAKVCPKVAIFLAEAMSWSLVCTKRSERIRSRQRFGFDPWVGKIPRRRLWQLTPVFLPGESHRQGSLVGYSAWNHTELDRIEEEPRSALESRRVSLGAHWVDSRESSLLRRLERGGETGL